MCFGPGFGPASLLLVHSLERPPASFNCFSCSKTALSSLCCLEGRYVVCNLTLKSQQKFATPCRPAPYSRRPRHRRFGSRRGVLTLIAAAFGSGEAALRGLLLLCRPLCCLSQLSDSPLGCDSSCSSVTLPALSLLLSSLLLEADSDE